MRMWRVVFPGMTSGLGREVSRVFVFADWAETTNATVRVLTGGTYVRDPPELGLWGLVMPWGMLEVRWGSRSDSSSTRESGGRPGSLVAALDEPPPEEDLWGRCGRRLRASWRAL